MQTELFLTFSTKDAADGNLSKMSGGGHLASSMLIPRAQPETAGRFRVWVAHAEQPQEPGLQLVWDRKARGGFPELSELVSAWRRPN